MVVVFKNKFGIVDKVIFITKFFSIFSFVEFLGKCLRKRDYTLRLMVCHKYKTKCRIMLLFFSVVLLHYFREVVQKYFTCDFLKRSWTVTTENLEGTRSHGSNNSNSNLTSSI